MDRIIVLDPNVWITFAWNNDYSLVRQSVLQGIILASSDEAVNEVESVLRRKKFAGRISAENLQKILLFYRTVTTLFKPVAAFTASPDPNDDYLFDLCRESGATYLVTGDKALLALNTVPFDHHSTNVITLRQFGELLAS